MPDSARSLKIGSFKFISKGKQCRRTRGIRVMQLSPSTKLYTKAQIRVHQRMCRQKIRIGIHFFFLPPFFSFFSFLGLSSCLPWGLYLADQVENDSNSSCPPQHAPDSVRSELAT